MPAVHYDLIRMLEPGKWCVVTVAVDPATRRGEVVDARYCREHELPTGDVVWTGTIDAPAGEE